MLADIRKQVGGENLFTGNSLKRKNCRVILSGVSESDRVIVDLDKVFPHGKQGVNLCECVLFYFDDTDNFVIIPIELKGGKNAEAAKAVKQLKGGAAYADSLTPSGSTILLIPILFHNHLSRAEIRQLRKSESSIQFRGKNYEIKTARCGRKLAEMLT